MKTSQVFTFAIIFLFSSFIFVNCSNEEFLDSEQQFTKENEISTRDFCGRSSINVTGTGDGAWDGTTACAGSQIEVEAVGLCEPISWVIQGASSYQAISETNLLVNLPGGEPTFIWIEATGCDGCSTHLDFLTSTTGICAPTGIGFCVVETIGDECYCRKFPFSVHCDMQ